ncbi:MAG: type II secretion system F family protein [Myxococcota bacterium]|nr:type II secretion system F family protein [Myxococcota bacterium]
MWLTMAGYLVPIAIGVSASVAVIALADLKRLQAIFFLNYQSWWQDRVERARVNPKLSVVPAVQGIAVASLLLVCLVFNAPVILMPALLIGITPPWLLVRFDRSRTMALENGLDAFLTALADALTAVPNLAEALQGLCEHMAQPIKDEVVATLAEVRLGRSIDDALTNMAQRLALPGFDAAVGAALLGKRTGGDLPTILRRIAFTAREMSRLEGVIKSKTAEGRGQAWVMGVMPLALILMLELINPEWLAPMWSDPIGWILIGSAAVLEFAAVALIRKIMAVDI